LYATMWRWLLVMVSLYERGARSPAGRVSSILYRDARERFLVLSFAHIRLLLACERLGGFRYPAFGTCLLRPPTRSGPPASGPLAERSAMVPPRAADPVAGRGEALGPRRR